MDNRKKKKRVMELVTFLCILMIITYFSKFLILIESTALALTAKCLFNLALGGVALIFIKIAKMKPDYGFRNYKAYLVGLAIAIILQVIIGVIPALLGQSMIGGHTDFEAWSFAYQLFFYVLIIGPVEELIFRVYVQDSIIELLPGNKWIGVVVASILFGFWHIVNGNIVQVIFTTLIGCVFGFCKFRIKNCKYAGVAFGHGLYDLLNVVTRILFVQ